MPCKEEVSVLTPRSVWEFRVLLAAPEPEQNRVAADRRVGCASLVSSSADTKNADLF